MPLQNLQRPSKLFEVLKVIVPIAVGAILLVVLLQVDAKVERASALARQRDTEYTKLSDSIQRSGTQLASSFEEVKAFAETAQIDLETVQDDLDLLGARIEAVAIASSKTKTVVREHYSSTVIEKGPSEVPVCKESGIPLDVHGYTKTIETIQIRDSNGMRVADASFTAAEERPWTSKSYGLRYKSLSVLGKTEAGRYTLHSELTASSEAEPDKVFKIDALESEMIQAPIDPPRFRAWDPSLMLGISLGALVWPEINFSLSPELIFTVMSYGNWRFIGIGIGIDAIQRTFRIAVVPVLYNIGGPIPWLQDTWLNLSVGIDHELGVSVNLGIATIL